MFDRIAGLYDRMNSVMTAGLHHQWRRRAADLADLSSGGRALDVATGTGDLALELAARVAPDGEVVGVDFSEQRMLELARVGRPPPRRRRALRIGQCAGPRLPRLTRSTPQPWALVPATSATWSAGLSEMARVVRPGGWVVLDIYDRGAPSPTFFELWFDDAIPALGRVVDSQAYTYLPSLGQAGSESTGAGRDDVALRVA